MLAGRGVLSLAGTDHALELESGAYLAPGESYELRNDGAEPLRISSVRIPDPAPPAQTPDAAVVNRTVVRRLADQAARGATTDREFRIVADPSTGLRSATQFVGYIPTAKAPDHFHTYDEVIHVLDGEGVFHAAGEERELQPGATIELRRGPSTAWRTRARRRCACWPCSAPPARRRPPTTRTGRRLTPTLPHLTLQTLRPIGGVPKNEKVHERCAVALHARRGGLRQQQQQQYNQQQRIQRCHVDLGEHQLQGGHRDRGSVHGSGRPARAGAAALRTARGRQGQQGERHQRHAGPGRHAADAVDRGHRRRNAIIASNAVAAIGPAGSQEVEAVGPTVRQGRDRVRLRLGDAAGADHERQEPDVLPRRPGRRRPGPAGRELHHQPPAPEGRPDHRRRRGLLAGPRST